eukprot:gnl/Dysnectes_brevis/1147_a1281_4244.p1 GENE.gnl/Dysnectes_brevis/1147_a1281_4244~~gnl/Dysnectes_brevis/1147_a1281_4244.p1  ORF type:complete len:423 (+),score=139.84 gnl/Dysnectes_brevis/1147_a1281_4244:49-1269(+)
MCVSHVFIISAFIACCFASIPQMADSFSSKVSISTGMMSVSGDFYFDWPNMRQRIDSTGPFHSKSIELDLASEEVSYSISMMGSTSQCQIKDYQSFSSYDIPPIATYGGKKTYAGIECDYYSWVIGFEMDLCVTPSEVDDQLYVPVYMRVYMGPMTVEQTFTEVQVAPQADELFDPSQWGCPNPTPPVTYDVALTVYDATNRHAISGASGKLVGAMGYSYTSTSDSNGKLSFTGVAEDDYTLSITASNYISYQSEFYVDSYIAPGTQYDAFLSPILPTGQRRVVLSWLSSPRDLDLYLFDGTPDSYSCFVYYNQKTGCSGVSLDIDVVSGNGPETLTITTDEDYYITVKNYSGESPIVNSEAVVRFYDSNGLIEEVHIPDGATDARIWDVATFSGSGNVDIINTLR